MNGIFDIKVNSDGITWLDPRDKRRPQARGVRWQDWNRLVSAVHLYDEGVKK